MKKLLGVLSTLILWAACSPSPKPITYGTDKCDFCRMTIVDPQFAAELVTEKGRVYKFDAIECMGMYRLEEPGTGFAFLLVNDYLRAGTLQPVTDCTFLISPELPSPMGANLSAFYVRDSAKVYQERKGGQLYSWDALLATFDQNK
jgi:copper chaperone NosL